MNPKYPVYIISKGRWESRLTSRALERINVPYHIVIEPQEYKQYAAVINPAKIFVLPFSNLGQGRVERAAKALQFIFQFFCVHSILLFKVQAPHRLVSCLGKRGSGLGLTYEKEKPVCPRH